MDRLKESIESNNTEAAREILLENPEILIKSDDQKLEESPFWHAVLHGSEEIIDLLVEFGAKANEWYGKSFFDKKTYLHYIVMNDIQIDTRKVEILLQHGADPNADTPNVDSPFEIAVWGNQMKWIELFLKNGANVENLEFMLIMLPRSNIGKELLLLFIKNGLVDLNFRDSNGGNLLHVYAGSPHLTLCLLQIIEYLVDAGVPINDFDNRGFTPLLHASDRENLEIINFLIEKGADVNKENNNEGMFPLYLAVSRDSKDIVFLLISNGADVNAKTHVGRTALHAACDYLNHKLISFLIHKGASISEEDNFGKTPFSVMNLTDSKSELCMIAMVKEFAKLGMENIPIALKDLDLINTYPKIKEYFEMCKDELRLLKSTKFDTVYSYYSILKMSKKIKKLAYLVKNEEFKKSFEENLSFSYYNGDLKRIFNLAVKFIDKSAITYFKLINIFKNCLPDTVTRRLSEYLTPEDILE